MSPPFLPLNCMDTHCFRLQHMRFSMLTQMAGTNFFRWYERFGAFTAIKQFMWFKSFSCLLKCIQSYMAACVCLVLMLHAQYANWAVEKVARVLHKMWTEVKWMLRSFATRLSHSPLSLLRSLSDSPAMVLYLNFFQWFHKCQKIRIDGNKTAIIQFEGFNRKIERAAS